VEQVLVAAEPERLAVGLEQHRCRVREAEPGPDAVEQPVHVRGQVNPSLRRLALQEGHELARHAPYLRIRSR
jgi:hypothetical protein